MAYPFEPDRLVAADAGDGPAPPPMRRLPIISADERLADRPRGAAVKALQHHLAQATDRIPKMLTYRVADLLLTAGCNKLRKARWLLLLSRGHCVQFSGWRR